MKKIRYLIWDFDGTLQDTYPAIARAVNLALEQFHKAASLERIIELASVSLNYCIAKLAKEYHIDEQELDAVLEEIYKTVRPVEQVPFEYTKEICQHIIDSGGSNYIVTHRRTTSLIHLLELHTIKQYFQDIVAGDAGFPKKPDPAAFNYIIQKHKLAKEEVLVIGDRDLDILAAQQAGLVSCLFRGAFDTVSPTHSIDNFAELYELLRKL